MTTATRISGLGAMALAAALTWGGAASALAVADCARVTHVSHGGEAGHRDFGQGVVGWLDWWSQEGVQEAIVLADCASGETLTTVTRSENMNRDLPFDRTDRAVDTVTSMMGSPVMRGFAQIAGRLAELHLHPLAGSLTTQPCACAALYPDLRGDRPEFQMEPRP